METEMDASLDAVSAPAVGGKSSNSGDAKPLANSMPSSAVDGMNVADSTAPSSRPTAQPQAPQTPSVAPGVKQGSMTTATERERAAREVLQALTAASSLACSSAKTARNRGGGGGSGESGGAADSSARRILFTADDADSEEEDFASDDSDAVERALRRARGRAAGAGSAGAGGGRRRPQQQQQQGDAATAAAASKASSSAAAALQPANASARRLDAVFDGALRQVYFHDRDGDDEFDDLEDNVGGGGGGKGGGGGNGGNNASSSSNSLAARTRDKADRATVETVLDPRTRLVLFKLLNNGVFASIHGCVSTGKEANVYLALPGPSRASSPFGALAVKVYKTSILAFKDRERYVEGDARFSGGNGNGGGGGFGGGGGGGRGASSKAGYCKGNARKMVRAWAEKEARNLARLAAAGVRAPAVVCLRSHVLAMEFVSSDGGGEGGGGGRGAGDGNDAGSTTAAPRLKDARLSRSRAARAYKEALGAMRAMWARARLVHADLSEYNMLYAPVRRLKSEEEEGEEEEGAGEEEEEGDGGENGGDGGENGGDGGENGGDGGDKEAKKKKKSKPKKRPPTHSVVVIDVSQSVDLDHPRALEFLRIDATNVNAFFARRGVPPLTQREVFDFVTADAGAYPDSSEGGEGSAADSAAPSVARATPFAAATAASPTPSCADFDPRKTAMMTRGEERFLDSLLASAASRSEASLAAGGALAPERSAEDAVWASAHIPRRLADVADAERDAARLAVGGGAAEGIYYQRFAGMTEDMGKVRIEEGEGRMEGKEEEKERKKNKKKKKKAVSFASVAADGNGEEEEEAQEGAAAPGASSSSSSSDSDDASSSSSLGSDDDSDDSDFSDSDDGGGSDASDSRQRRRSLKARACSLPPEEADAARALRKAAKAQAKAGARERRKTKTPKHVKKRAAAKARKKKK